ncbi:hypothetical protein LEP1GSC173_2111 [Leptospira interrogans str. HAI1594]|uniref:Uncharacterized protein n=2 Tax=Leptospira interrogans TaxID=173 RepID=A0A0E2D7C1_LEPIR|nr:hypothetical protein LEP1GSC007_2624 [Leptospira interrogans serovar Bulgarica str. Mallika]EKO07400.1 hypothetical protein LEP1GSC077_0854 [Leptospira interrogans str. C10069]EKO98153.1 hypothetical protein LEP1GSC057_3518 [Leptospira interrogans str. Brem 329]EKP20530.1 hypothetical protein LEP1GSC117_2448 [Leptospira interrogans serovar Icterohaemorrhagiae str. Verdun LP]EKP74644.1 hypothetical protein LEP1GSC173_2111 [Leptospira interrogans str. HAI1594]EKR44257.1 hypothetical protein L
MSLSLVKFFSILFSFIGVSLEICFIKGNFYKMNFLFKDIVRQMAILCRKFNNRSLY